jgi:hypothetical protein
MDQTGAGRVDFDTLYERVVTHMPETWIFVSRPSEVGRGSCGRRSERADHDR